MGVIIRQSIKGTLVNYLGTLISVFTTFFVMTRVLTAEEIGLTRILVEAATLFAGLAQLGTTSSAIRYYPYFKEQDSDEDHGFFFWTLLVPVVGFLVYGVVFYCLRHPISAFFAEKSPLFSHYYYLLFPLGFCLLYIRVFETNANILMRIAVPKLIREVVIRLLTLLVYLLYAMGLFGLDGFVWAFCSIYAVATLLNVFYLFSIKKIVLTPDLSFLTRDMCRSYLLYTLFLITAALSGSLMPFLNTLFVSARMGLSYTGIFTIALNIAALVEIPYRSLGAITTPHISKAVKENDVEETNRLCQSVSLHQLLAGSFIFFLIWINIDLLFALLPNGELYATAKAVVFILCLAKLFNASFSVGTSVLSYSNYYYYSLPFAFLLTLSGIFLNNLFIPMWGMSGAAIASFVSYVGYYAILLGLIAYKMRTSPFSKPQLKVLAVMLLLFLLNEIWQRVLTPLASNLPWPTMLLALLNAMLKTSVLSVLGMTIIYRWNISLQVNRLWEKVKQNPYLCRFKK